MVAMVMYNYSDLVKLLFWLILTTNTLIWCMSVCVNCFPIFSLYATFRVELQMHIYHTNMKLVLIFPSNF